MKKRKILLYIIFVIILFLFILGITPLSFQNDTLFDISLGNKYINSSILLLIIIELVIFITPIRNIFNLVPLSIGNVFWCIFIVLITFIIDELSKNIINNKFKD